MPAAYKKYGWRRYRSGECSYKGYDAPCPEEHDYYDSKKHEKYYDELYRRASHTHTIGY